MRTKMIDQSLRFLILAGVMVLGDQAFSKDYSQKGYTLDVAVLDAKMKTCTGQPSSVSGVQVRMRPNVRDGVWRTASTDGSGIARFTNVMAGLTYSISVQKYVEGVGSLCDPKTISYAMPNASAQITVALDNCWTTSSYDISARFLSSSTEAVTVGHSYTVSFVLTNKGANGPSRSNVVRLVRYYGDIEGSHVAIGSSIQVPELCVNQEVGFDVTDSQLTVGGWIYTLEWERGPDQGVTINNHRPTKTIVAKPK